MEAFQPGALIKELRWQRKWTQEKLCKGICGSGTLARIESGKQNPEWFTYSTLMERLGEDPHKYYSGIITLEDKMLTDLDDELSALLDPYDDESLAKAEAIINSHEPRLKTRPKRYRQMILFYKANLLFKRKEYDKAYALANEAITVTKPNFDEQTVEDGIYSSMEIDLVNLIAALLNFVKSHHHSTMVYKKLKESLDKNYRADKYKQRTYKKILYNITMSLLEEFECAECLPLCTEGIKICTKERNYHYLALFLYNKGWCLLYINERDEGLDLIRQACAIFYGASNHSALSHVKSEMVNRFALSQEELNFIKTLPNVM